MKLDDCKFGEMHFSFGLKDRHKEMKRERLRFNPSKIIDRQFIINTIRNCDKFSVGQIISLYQYFKVEADDEGKDRIFLFIDVLYQL